MKKHFNSYTKLFSYSLLFACMLLLGTLQVSAQGLGSLGETGSRAGTAGGEELLVPLTANYASLGGATTSGVSNMNGLEAIFTNPAGLTVNDGTSALFSRVEYVADIGVNYIGIGQSFGYNQIALTISAWDFGDIPETTEISPEVSDVTFNVNFLTVGFTYARQLTDRIAAGATVKLISESIDDVTASAFAFDAGMTYDVSGTGLRLGVSLKNIGSELQFSGPGLTKSVLLPGQEPSSVFNPVNIENEAVTLPTLLNFGVAYTYDISEQADVTVLGNYRSNSFDQDNFAGGVELGLLDMIFVRGGVQLVDDMDATFYQGYSFGGGLKLDLAGTQLHVDYAYTPTDFFDDVQYITASIRL